MRRIETVFPVGSGHDKSLKLRYTIRPERLSDGSGELTRCYGIVVRVSRGEREHIRAITTSAVTASRLMLVMARRHVTPATARDVVYDWLCARDGA